MQTITVTKIVLFMLSMAIFMSSGDICAAPAISGVSGTLMHGSAVTISGGGFGVKSHAAPLKWDNFENGTLGSNVESTGYWTNYGGSGDIKFTDSRLRHPLSTRSVVDKMTYSWPNTTPNSNFYRLDVWPYAGKKYFTGYLYVDLVNLVTPGEWQAKLIHVLSGTEHADWPVLALQSWWTESGQVGNNGNYFEFAYTGGEWYSAWNDWVRAGEWVRFEVEWQDSSSYTATDGFARFTAYHPNESVVSSTRTGTTMAADGKTITTPHFGYLLVNEQYGHEVDTYWDDIYMDDTWARVELCAGSTWVGRSNCEIQVPSAWSPDSITIDATLGALANDSNAYLYIVDANGNANSNGYPVTLFAICPAHAATIEGDTVYYSSISSAYAEAGSGKKILIQAMTFNEDLDVNKNITIKGGYDCGFTSNPGYSTVIGKVTVGGPGKVIIEKLIIQ
jgi:hypothetical protein